MNERNPQRPSDPEEKAQELATLVAGFRFGMFVNVSADDQLRARPMTIIDRTGVAAKKDDAAGDSRLTFATSLDNTLVDDLQREPRVCVTLQEGYKYVSLTCTATPSRDRERIRALWSKGLEAWFPDGPDDPKVVLLECVVTFAEFWDVSGFERVRYAIEAGRAYVRDDAMNPRNAGKHGELSGRELQK